MAQKPRNKAGMDAAAVARMMAAQDQDEATEVPAPEAEPAMASMREVPAGRGHVPPEGFDPGKVDGRTLRRTGREPFATRIKPEAHEALRRIAYARGITIAEALELAVAALDTR